MASATMARGPWTVESQGRRTLLDPRTKLLLLVTLPTFLMGGAGGAEMGPFLLAFPLIPVALLVLSGAYRTALAGVGVMVAAELLWTLAAPLVGGSLYLLLYVIYEIVLGLSPCVLMGIYAIKTTTVSEFVSGMERLRIPQLITIPTSVMFRFFPTVSEEAASINDAMYMRGIRLGGKGVLKMVEYRLVPMMMCSLRIGDELSAAALTRGLGAPVRRTSVCRIGLHVQDVLLILACVAAFATWALGALGVFA